MNRALPTPDALARAYGVPLIDAGTGRNAVIVSSGAGIMSAAFDLLVWRYCIDIDTLKSGHRFADWLQAVEYATERIVVVGWFSLTDPKPLRAALAALQEPRRVLIYTPFTDLGCARCDSLGELVRSVAALDAERDVVRKRDLEEAEASAHREGGDAPHVTEHPGQVPSAGDAACPAIITSANLANGYEINDGDGVPRELAGWIPGAADDERSPVIGAPGAQLDRLPPFEDRLGPGGTDGDGAHPAHGESLTSDSVTDRPSLQSCRLDSEAAQHG